MSFIFNQILIFQKLLAGGEKQNGCIYKLAPDKGFGIL